MGLGRWAYRAVPFLHTSDWFASCSFTCSIAVYDLPYLAILATIDRQMVLWGLGGLIRGHFGASAFLHTSD